MAKKKETKPKEPEVVEDDKENEQTAVIAKSGDTIDIDTSTTKSRLSAIKEFQAICRKELKEGKDFGEIPGIGRPTLLKPGAEKIIKLLGLADHHEVTKEIEDWSGGFFMYRVKTVLRSVKSGVVISEGIGSCNSKESKFRWRWLYENQLPKNLSKDDLVSKSFRSRKGAWYTKYRIENDDIYSIVNTLLKVAKKRAMVDAALSVGRLSDLYTQDVEEIEQLQNGAPKPASKPKPKPKPKPAPKPAPKKDNAQDKKSSPLPTSELADKIKSDIRIRFSDKDGSEYREFKKFLLDFQSVKEKKWVKANQYGHLSLSLGDPEDIKLITSNIGWVMGKYVEWKRTQDQATDDDIPF